MEKENYFIANRSTILEKWGPITSNLFNGIKNQNMLDIISLYTEWLQIKIQNDPDIQFGTEYTGLEEPKKYNNDTLPIILKFTNRKIMSLNVRKKVMSEWYNPITGCIEHLLEDGIFININIEPLVDLELYCKVFPPSFISNIYPDIARDMRLNNILDT